VPVSPIALEAVKRIDALFAIEREINGLGADERRQVRQERSCPLVADMRTWLGEQRLTLSRSATVAEPIDYMLRRWDRFASFLDDGRACLSNNAAERALRGFALGRKAWLFAGSDRGAERAAAMATLIQTAKMNDVDPQAWLADVLARIAGIHKANSPASYLGIGCAVDCTRALKMHVNKVHSVRTLALVASDHGEEADWLADLALDMEPEDGLIWVYDPEHQDGTMAFTEFGIESLCNLIEIHRGKTE
jgi:hypothetical protein